MKWIRGILSHLAAILSLVMLTLLIFDHFNPYMEFLNNIAAKTVLLVLCLVCLSTTILTTVFQKKE